MCFQKCSALGLTDCWPVIPTAWFCILLKLLPRQLRTVLFDTFGVSEIQDFNIECSRVKSHRHNMEMENWGCTNSKWSFKCRLSVCTWEKSFNDTHTHTQPERPLSCISAEQYRRCTFFLPSTLANSCNACQIKSGKDSLCGVLLSWWTRCINKSSCVRGQMPKLPVWRITFGPKISQNLTTELRNVVCCTEQN